MLGLTPGPWLAESCTGGGLVGRPTVAGCRSCLVCPSVGSPWAAIAALMRTRAAAAAVAGLRGLVGLAGRVWGGSMLLGRLIGMLKHACLLVVLFGRVKVLWLFSLCLGDRI